MQFFPAVMNVPEQSVRSSALSAPPKTASSFLAVLTAQEHDQEQAQPMAASKLTASQPKCESENKESWKKALETDLPAEMSAIFAPTKSSTQVESQLIVGTKKPAQEIKSREKNAGSRSWSRDLHSTQSNPEDSKSKRKSMDVVESKHSKQKTSAIRTDKNTANTQSKSAPNIPVQAHPWSKPQTTIEVSSHSRFLRENQVSDQAGTIPLPTAQTSGQTSKGVMPKEQIEAAYQSHTKINQHQAHAQSLLKGQDKEQVKVESLPINAQTSGQASREITTEKHTKNMHQGRVKMSQHQAHAQSLLKGQDKEQAKSLPKNAQASGQADKETSLDEQARTAPALDLTPKHSKIPTPNTNPEKNYTPTASIQSHLDALSKFETKARPKKTSASLQKTAAPLLQTANITPEQNAPEADTLFLKQKKSHSSGTNKQATASIKRSTSKQSNQASSSESLLTTDLGLSTSKAQANNVETKVMGPESQLLAASKQSMSETAPVRGADAPLPRSVEVYQQVADGTFNTLSQGKKQLVIRLDPPELGQVSIVLQVRGKDLQAVFRATSPEATQALSDQLGQLRQQLENQGFRVARLEVQQQFSEGQADTHWQNTEQHNGSQAQREAAMSQQRLRVPHKAGENLAQDVQEVPHTEKKSSTGLDIFA